LWVDANANGISEAGELVSVNDANFEVLPIISKNEKPNRFDNAGNWLPLQAKARLLNGKKVKVVDVYFDIVD